MVTFTVFCSSYSKPFEALLSSGLLQPMPVDQQDLTGNGNCVIMPDDYEGTVDQFHRQQCAKAVAAKKRKQSRFGKKTWFGYFWEDHACYIKARDEYNT